MHDAATVTHAKRQTSRENCAVLLAYSGKSKDLSGQLLSSMSAKLEKFIKQK